MTGTRNGPRNSPDSLPLIRGSPAGWRWVLGNRTRAGERAHLMDWGGVMPDRTDARRALASHFPHNPAGAEHGQSTLAGNEEHDGRPELQQSHRVGLLP